MTEASVVDASPLANLTIGDLADQTGVSPATLRVWEARHGFPVPQRLESGHRRYSERDVQAVRQVVKRRDAGVRLDVAIAQAGEEQKREDAPLVVSIFAELRRSHPQLPAHRLTKHTLMALSWAIEDEVGARSERAHLFGAFQDAAFFEAARERWTELGRVSRSAFVFADFSKTTPPEDPETRPTRVHLPADAPMRREWAVVCDAPHLPVAMVAWEVPGQRNVADRDRVFESVWTIEAAVVRAAARVCATVAAQCGADGIAPVLYHLADDPGPTTTDPATISTLFSRVLAYTDQHRHV